MNDNQSPKKIGTLDRLIGRILGNENQKFDEVHIDRELIDEIVQIAREAYPNEFIALLEDKIKDDILTIDGMVFLPGDTSNEGAVMNVFMKPMITGTVGSVHSHPGYNASPSNADLYFFSKNGLFHLIIAEPYEKYSIRAYDSRGIDAEFRIV